MTTNSVAGCQPELNDIQVTIRPGKVVVYNELLRVGCLNPGEKEPRSSTTLLIPGKCADFKVAYERHAEN
jgi:hypothetical protein